MTPKRKAPEPDELDSAAKAHKTGDGEAASSNQAGLTATGGGACEAPTKPSQSDIDAGVAIPVRQYMEALIPYVQARLTAFLKQQKAPHCGRSLTEVPPFQISQDAKKSYKNFREPWNMNNCLVALTSTHLYEASGNVFWLDVLGTKFGEYDLTDAEVTWHRLRDAASLWSEEAFVSSCEDPQHRRFIFPGYLPAAIANTSHIEAMVKSKACHFNKLSLLGGHALIDSWYVALADALQAGLTSTGEGPIDSSRVWKLFEAGMTANIRLRLTTSHTQVLSDAHVWSETIRATHMSGSCDLLNFVKRLTMMPEVVRKGTSVEKLRKLLADLGVQYRCKPVDKNAAMGIMALIPVVNDVACMQALSPLRELFPKLTSEMTKMMRLAQVCKATWGDTAMCERLSYVFQCLFVALMRQDVVESEMTTSWLVGDRGPGFMQLSVTKKSILDFMFRAVHLAADHAELQQSSEVIINDVLPRFQSPIAMYKAFLQKQDAGMTASDGANMAASDDNEQQGKVVESGSESGFETWLQTLTNKGAKTAAQLFHDICIGVHDEAYRSTNCCGSRGSCDRWGGGVGGGG